MATSATAQLIETQNPLPNPVIDGKWFQLYTKLARPTLDWVGVLSAFVMLNILPLAGAPMDEGQLMVSLFFIASLYGIRSYERTRGVA